MGTWVRLKSAKHLEVQGKLKKYLPGDWVEVGKQTALAWVAAGEAEMQVQQAGVPAGGGTCKPHPTQSMLDIPQSVQIPAFTLFAVPMAFQHEHVAKQNNAISSWTLLEPKPVIFLFGEEPGITDAAVEHGCLHLPRLACNEFGTPLVGDAFRQAQMLAAPDDVICYVNSDIILLQDFADALATVAERFAEPSAGPPGPCRAEAGSATMEQFLMVGQRWDVDLNHPLAFREGWQKRLRKLIASKGKRHGVGAVDYFAFRPGLYGEIPPFVIGRSCWDNWLMAHALAQGVAVVDASEAATAVHQDKGSTEHVMTEERLAERRRNRALYDADREAVTGKISNAGWIIDADGNLTERGERK